MSVFSIVFPLIFIVLLGYGAAKTQFLEQIHIAGLSKFTFYISVPAFLFLNMAQADLAHSFNSATLWAFYVPVISIFLLGAVLDRYLFKKQHHRASSHAVYALGCSYSNTVLVGLPIIIAAMGNAMIGSVFMIITFHSALLFALTFLLSAKGQEQAFSWRQFAKTMLLNPVVMSITSGLIINILGITLFNDLAIGIELLAQPAIACALFVLGSNLAFYRIGEDWQQALLASVIKIVLLPAFVFTFGHFVIALPQDQLAIVVLLSAAPLGVNAYLVANQIGQHQATLASTVVLSTLLCVISFSVWLSILLPN